MNGLPQCGRHDTGRSDWSGERNGGPGRFVELGWSGPFRLTGKSLIGQAVVANGGLEVAAESVAASAGALRDCELAVLRAGGAELQCLHPPPSPGGSIWRLKPKVSLVEHPS